MRKLIFLMWPGLLLAQPSLETILQRLDKVEQENARLRDEVRQLRERVERGAEQTTEKLEIQERRVEEQAQSKVEASQRFPVRVTGMALFNTFWNGRHSGGQDVPLSASAAAGPAVAGATMRQTVLGLEFDGPTTLAGGRVHGSLYADFFSGATEGNILFNTARVRTASIEVEWDRRSLLVGQEKPIFAPREPNSLSVVGVSPLTGSGNLWRWHPQVRYEERIPLAADTRLTAQLGIYQTQEDLTLLPVPVASVERRRPGYQGRFELSHRFDENRRVELASGFHASSTHAAGASIPSRVFSLDWFANPVRKVELSGTFFRGRNLAHFGALRQSLALSVDGRVIPVHSLGGWGQITVLATDRITWNLLGGMHDDRDADLRPGQTALNRSGASNLMFRVAPNVIVSLEALQLRTTFLGSGRRINNRYDLAVAYQF